MTKNPIISAALNIQDSPIHQAVIQRVTRMLDAAKIAYAIQIGEGQYIGELPVAPPAPVRKKINNWCAEVPGYVDQIKSMKFSDVLRWTLSSPERAKDLRSIVSSQGVHYHGKGSVITATSGNEVEVMRVE